MSYCELQHHTELLPRSFRIVCWDITTLQRSVLDRTPTKSFTLMYKIKTLGVISNVWTSLKEQDISLTEGMHCIYRKFPMLNISSLFFACC